MTTAAQKPADDEQLTCGDWVKPVMSGFHIECCDCGLDHLMKFQVVDGKVWFQMWRDSKATKAARRKNKRRAAKAA